MPYLARNIHRQWDNTYITCLPEFSHIVRFNKFTYGYYHLDGRAVPDISEIIADNIPVVRYVDPTDSTYEIVKFVSKEEFPEDSVMLYQYETPMEICTKLAPMVAYFQINLIPTMRALYNRVSHNPFRKSPGFETTKEQVSKVYEYRKNMMHCQYRDQIETLVLHSYYQDVGFDRLSEIISDFLFKIDEPNKVSASRQDLGVRFHLFRCIDNLELKILRGDSNNEK